MSYKIGRPTHGETLDKHEWAHDEHGKLLVFHGEREAVNFLSEIYPHLSRIDIVNTFCIVQHEPLEVEV